MGIYDRDLFGRTKHSVAIARIRNFCTGKRVLCAFSGGKDSQCCYHLMEEAGVSFTAQYSITRFEPIELLNFMQQNYPSITRRKAYKMSLWDEIVYSGLPNMFARWCCNAKHVKTEGFDIAVVGIRWEESAKRRNNWRMFGFKQDKTAYLCPIVEWTTEDVWEYLGNRPHCKLYDEGFKRIGCVCCPLSPAKMLSDSLRWPKTSKMLKGAACAFVYRMKARGYKTQRTDCADWAKSDNPAEEYWNRWIHTGQTAKSITAYGVVKDDNQCVFEGSGFSELDGKTEDY